jgi:hypothetical protein
VSFGVTRADDLRRLLTTAPVDADSFEAFRPWASDFLNSELIELIVDCTLAGISCIHAIRRMHMTPRQYLRTPNVSRTLSHIVRVMAPTLIALSFATVAHAQGTMDFSGAQTLMGTFKTFAVYAGAVICFGGLIFAGIRMMSGRFQDAIPGLFGALFGAGVLGWGAGWIGSLTGQQM